VTRSSRDRPGERTTLVVHAARHLPMDAERRARATAAAKALLLPYLREQRAVASRLDTARLVEASSEPGDNR
jgi:hypothetical protein